MPYRYVCRMKGLHKITFGRMCFITITIMVCHIHMYVYIIYISLYIHNYVCTSYVWQKSKKGTQCSVLQCNVTHLLLQVEQCIVRLQFSVAFIVVLCTMHHTINYCQYIFDFMQLYSLHVNCSINCVSVYSNQLPEAMLEDN